MHFKTTKAFLQKSKRKKKKKEANYNENKMTRIYGICEKQF